MSHKSPRILALVEPFRNGQGDARYLAYFDCFNRQLYFEAHDVLEELWLGKRKGPNDAFHKGLIQLAGAFVHLQKGRAGPASAVLRLAEANLARYPSFHEQLDIEGVLVLIRECLRRLEKARDGDDLLRMCDFPRLRLGCRM